MYSTHNEGKSVVAERFIRTIKNKIYKYNSVCFQHLLYINVFKVLRKITCLCMHILTHWVGYSTLRGSFFSPTPHLSKARWDYARTLKLGTKVTTDMQLQKI